MGIEEKTRQDFECTNEQLSIKELVKEEYFGFMEQKGAGQWRPQSEDSLDELLRRVYTRIEKGALEAYKSNELWAISAWCYDNILKDSVAKEAVNLDDNLLSGLVQPIKEWQESSFDPLLNYKRKLTLSGKSQGYIRECMASAARFVAKYGKRTKYSVPQQLEFLEELKNRLSDSSFCTKAHELKSFINSLPEDELGRKVKFALDRVPSYPTEFHQPLFSKEEIEALIIAATFLEDKPEVVLRLAVATLYGARVGELAQLTSESINVSDGTATIKIPTEKKGRRVPQPIPQELIPLFSIPLERTRAYVIQRDFKRACRKAGITIPRRGGIHCIRRSVVTALHSVPDIKDITIHRFMRWSDNVRGLGVMPRYIKTPTEESDMSVLNKHPFADMWKLMIPFVAKLPQYNRVCNIALLIR